MKNFDDDPADDALSDESIDSFFNSAKASKKRANLTKTPDKKAISDLFGLNDDKPKEKSESKQSDWLGLDDEKPVVPEPPRSATSTSSRLAKKISFEDDDDEIIGSLALGKGGEDIPDTPKASETSLRKQEPVKRSALMESLFGAPKQQTTELGSSFDDILKESKIGKQKGLSPARSGDNLTITPTETRRSRHISSSSGVPDTLGLLSISKKEEESSTKISRPDRGEGDAKTSNAEMLHTSMTKNLKTKSAPNIKDLPEWLGEGSAVKTYKSDTFINRIEKEDQHRDIEAKENKIDEQTNRTNITDVPMLETLLTQQKLATSHMEYQNATIALQQQESQLLMALQLKKYEENLAEMQKKQQDILLQQERQFNSLLERQFAKQQIMENNMRMQQERINNHIQLLISQPPVANRIDAEEQEERVQLKKNKTDENSRLYEEMIETLKQRQHEEIFLLNESYKKQITVLENSMEAVENRLKDELNALSEQFQSSQDNMKKEHEAEIDKYKQKINEMSNLHANEIKLIRENNSRIVEEIKHEYMMMVENLKQVKQTESSLLDNAGVYAQKLDTNLEVLDTSSKMLNNIREKVQQDYNILSLAREESLKAKEEEIKMMRSTLEKCREAAETERAQLMTLVRTLEMKLVEQSQNGKEERWALQQASAVLAARSAGFDREMEFARDSLERDKEQLKTLKESMLAEQEKIMLQLTEEKLYVSAEKSRLETTAKLSQNYDNQKARAEIEAAILVTKQATEATDREREALHKQRGEIEILKRNLFDKERKLELRNDELQEMLRKADEKMMEGERAIREAKGLEVKCNARLKDIQGQLMSLGNREKKLAEEKISLSKERLSLHHSLRQVKKCSLCAVDDLSPEGNACADNAVEQDFIPRMYPVTDPDLVRLRSDISE